MVSLVLEHRVEKSTGKLNVYNQDLSEKDKAIGKVLRRAIDKKVEFFRTDSATYEEFKVLAELCLSSVISSASWKANFSRVKLSNLLTVADEALALIVLENNVEEWIAQVEGKEQEKPSKKRKLTRYTGKGRKIDGTKKGWSMEGKRRYNLIFDEVVKNRNGEFSKSRETDLLKDWGNNAAEMDLRLRAVAVNNKEEEIKREMERIREEENFVPRTSFGL